METKEKKPKVERGPEYFRQKRKEFLERNPNYFKEKIECPCGKSYTRSNSHHHRRTWEHLAYMSEKDAVSKNDVVSDTIHHPSAVSKNDQGEIEQV